MEGFINVFLMYSWSCFVGNTREMDGKYTLWWFAGINRLDSTGEYGTPRIDREQHAYQRKAGQHDNLHSWVEFQLMIEGVRF